MTTTPRTEGARSGAAELRADLTHLLTEYVYLTALKRSGRPGAGAALDANAADLSDVIGGLYGRPSGRRFRTLWRAQNAQAVGAYLHTLVPALNTETTTESLVAATPARAGDIESLRVGAGHMQSTARLFARGIVSERRRTFTGSVEAGASTLRSRLTALFTAHVYLSALARGSSDASADQALATNTAALEDVARSAGARLPDLGTAPHTGTALRRHAARMARAAELLADTIARKNPKRFPSA